MSSFFLWKQKQLVCFFCSDDIQIKLFCLSFTFPCLPAHEILKLLEFQAVPVVTFSVFRVPFSVFGFPLSASRVHASVS